MDRKAQRRRREVAPLDNAPVHVKASGVRRPDPTAGMDHMSIFRHLIAAGPTMHGHPGAPHGGRGK